MKKIIKRFWGVALILILLSTLLIGVVPQAAGAMFNYTWFSAMAISTAPYAQDANGVPVDGFSILAAAQSGSTIVCTATDNAAASYLIRSTDGGVTWAQVIPVPAFTPTSGNWTLVALAPDNPNIIAIVSTAPAAPAGYAAPNTVWLSKDGGSNFAQLGNLNAGAWINDIAIAPKVGGVSRVTVGGNSGRANSANLSSQDNAAYLVTWPLDAVSPTWTEPGTGVGLVAFSALSATDDNVMAIAYSPNYLADYALLVVTTDMGLEIQPYIAGSVDLHCYSYNTNLWDAAVEASFPRVIENAVTSANLTSCRHARITLDPNFFLGDEAAQIGFIATSITNNVTAVGTEVGGVYRLDYTSVGAANIVYQIYTGGVNSVGWDGTNLMLADRVQTPGVRTVRRSANALSPLPTFSPTSIYKTPATGNDTKLLFNATSGLGFAFSRGNGACIAKTTDYGKTFNGYAYVNSNFANLQDYWIKSDGSVIYALATDNVDMNLWKGSYAGMFYSWERVFMLAGVGTAGITTDQPYLVRADEDNPDNVYIGLRAGKTIFKSTDGGTNWSARSCSQFIQDFVVQDANTVYVAVFGAGNIVKTESGGLSWTDPPISVVPATYGFSYSLTIVADDQVLLGTTAGGVAYTTDGDTWTALGKTLFSAPTIVQATGLNTGDTIFVANAWSIGSWTLGASFMFNEDYGSGANNGLAYMNGVLYAYDTTTNDFRRWLYPTSPTIGVGIAPATDIVGNAPTVLNPVSYTNTPALMLNVLKVTASNS